MVGAQHHIGAPDRSNRRSDIDGVALPRIVIQQAVGRFVQLFRQRLDLFLQNCLILSIPEQLLIARDTPQQLKLRGFFCRRNEQYANKSHLRRVWATTLARSKRVTILCCWRQYSA